MQLVETMVAMQLKLNNETNGAGWQIERKTKTGKEINWSRCIYMECAELIDSFPWKHWKNIDAEPDMENVKIEVVDIWHFVMSIFLEHYVPSKAGSYLVDNDEFKNIQHKRASRSNDALIIEASEDLMREALDTNSLKDLATKFYKLMYKVNMNIEELYILYIGKNLLNSFRQNNGYKEGNYIKVWNGKEDNVWMQKIIKENKNTSPEELYLKLEETYKQETSQINK